MDKLVERIKSEARDNEGLVWVVNGHKEALEKDHASELEVVQRLEDKVRGLSAQLSNVQFTYRDPTKNFDRSKVKGVVAKLINVNDRSSMTALEVTAGGKLYNVVVDSEETGKQLLQNGALKRRVTIIPLNKIQPYVVQPRVQQTAARVVGKDNAELALSLVGYNEEVKNAMEYVFGSTFVCKTTDAAKEVSLSQTFSVTCGAVAVSAYKTTIIVKMPQSNSWGHCK